MLWLNPTTGDVIESPKRPSAAWVIVVETEIDGQTVVSNLEGLIRAILSSNDYSMRRLDMEELGKTGLNIYSNEEIWEKLIKDSKFPYIKTNLRDDGTLEIRYISNSKDVVPVDEGVSLKPILDDDDTPLSGGGQRGSGRSGKGGQSGGGGGDGDGEGEGEGDGEGDGDGDGEGEGDDEGEGEGEGEGDGEGDGDGRDAYEEGQKDADKVSDGLKEKMKERMEGKGKPADESGEANQPAPDGSEGGAPAENPTGEGGQGTGQDGAPSQGDGGQGDGDSQGGQGQGDSDSGSGQGDGGEGQGDGDGDGDGGDSQEGGEGGADGAGQGKGDGDGQGQEGNCDNCSGEGCEDAECPFPEEGDSGEDGDSDSGDSDSQDGDGGDSDKEADSFWKHGVQRLQQRLQEVKKAMYEKRVSDAQQISFGAGIDVKILVNTDNDVKIDDIFQIRYALRDMAYGDPNALPYMNDDEIRKIIMKDYDKAPALISQAKDIRDEIQRIADGGQFDYDPTKGGDSSEKDSNVGDGDSNEDENGEKGDESGDSSEKGDSDSGESSEDGDSDGGDSGEEGEGQSDSPPIPPEDEEALNQLVEEAEDGRDSAQEAFQQADAEEAEKASDEARRAADEAYDIVDAHEKENEGNDPLDNEKVQEAMNYADEAEEFAELAKELEEEIEQLFDESGLEEEDFEEFKQGLLDELFGEDGEFGEALSEREKRLLEKIQIRAKAKRGAIRCVNWETGEIKSFPENETIDEDGGWIQITKFFSPFETQNGAQIVVDRTIAGAYEMAEKLNILGVMNTQEARFNTTDADFIQALKKMRMFQVRVDKDETKITY